MSNTKRFRASPSRVPTWLCRYCRTLVVVLEPPSASPLGWCSVCWEGHRAGFHWDQDAGLYLDDLGQPW